MVNGKRKGAAGELEFSKVCTQHGYKARRTAQYCGKSGDASDVVGLPGMHVEVKRVEKLNIYDAIAQAKRDAAENGRRPMVAHRRNRGEWLITLPLEVFFEIYREWEAGTRDETD